MNSLPIFLGKFKPVCDRIMCNPNKDDVLELHKQIETTDNTHLQNVQQFLLVPLISRLELESRQSRVKIELYNVIKSVLERTELRNCNALKTIFIVLLKQMYNFEEARLIENVSEEETLAILGCIETAGRNAYTDCVGEYYRPENAPQIGQVLFTILLALDQYEFRAIKLQALNALLAVLYLHDDADAEDIVLRDQISGIVFYSLPKLWSSVSRVALGDSKTGKKTVERSLIALGRIICLIMEDDKMVANKPNNPQIADFKSLISATTNLSASGSTNAGDILKSKPDKKSSDWIQAASHKLKKPFQELISLLGNEWPSVRYELGRCCELWIARCSTSLGESMPTFVEIILILSEDESRQNSNYFTNVLRKHTTLAAVTRELLERHITRLPRTMQRQMVKEQILALTLLKAQLKHIPVETLEVLFSDSKFLELITFALSFSIEFDYDNTQLLLEEYSIRDVVRDEDGMRPWEQFKYIHKETRKITDLLQDICSLMNGSTVCRIIHDHLIQTIRSRPINVAETIKLLQLAANSSNLSPEEIEAVLEEFLDDCYWCLSTGVIENHNRNQMGRYELPEGIQELSQEVKYIDLSVQEQLEGRYLVSPLEAKRNVLVTCLLMETIADYSRTLGPERFQKYLFRVLYKLLANAGNKNYSLHCAGLLALKQVTSTFNLTGIDDLIWTNADYIMFFVNQNLKKSDQSESALDVISVVLQYCARDTVLGYVELIVQTLLDECAKYHRMSNLAVYLKVFGQFLMNMKKETPTFVAALEEEQIVQSWLDILHRIPEELNTDDNEAEEPMEAEDDLGVTKPELPKEVEITKQIVDVALKHISSREPREVVAAIDALIHGVDILDGYPDELLPLVHLIWAPLSKRFSDQNPIILRSCVRMLITLARSAKEFIHRRTIDEVLPLLNGILTKNCNILTDSNETGFRFSQQFKLVEVILDNYYVLLSQLNVQDQHLDSALEAAKRYLNKNQHTILSAAARKFFQDMYEYDGPAVYQKLCNHN